MRKSVFMFFLPALFVLLSFPMAVHAAFTSYAGPWQETISDPEEFSASYKGMDIVNAFHAYDDGYHYFTLELNGRPQATIPNNFADRYRILIDTTGGAAAEYAFGYKVVEDAGSLDFTKFARGFDKSSLSAQRDGKFLEWRIQDDSIGRLFYWWADTIKREEGVVTAIDITAKALATPIPCSALLLGTGLVALVGLRRRGRRIYLFYAN